MAQFICPMCGSKYFLTAKTGQKDVFQVVDGRTVEFIQSVTDDSNTADQSLKGEQTIYCGGCSWQGVLAEVVESHIE